MLKNVNPGRIRAGLARPAERQLRAVALVLARSRQAKERLVPCVSSGNYEQVRTPISAIVE